VTMRRYAEEAVVNDAQSDVSVARRPLRTISEIRSFFRTNVRPIFFVGPTAFNLLGIDRWVRNFGYLVYYDSWDGAHPLVFTPKNKPFVEFESRSTTTCCGIPRCRPTSRPGWYPRAGRR
jgi:hypothetical protein